MRRPPEVDPAIDIEDLGRALLEDSSHMHQVLVALRDHRALVDRAIDRLERLLDTEKAP